MNAQELYKKLDADFEIDRFTDSWPDFDLGGYLSENFKEKQMGVALDNAEEIEKVYTAVFPSDEVLDKILESKEENILLFTHHPRIWDLRVEGFPFKDFDHKKLEKMKERKISLYALHVPLDNNGEYSTSVNFAKSFGIEKEEDFVPYGGGMAGVIGKTDSITVSDLADKVCKAVGHEVKVFNYGSEEIKNGKVGVVAGGGNDEDAINEVVQKGINTYVTGITAITAYPPTIKFHEIAKENKINIISATHYSTEKFACMAMCQYFQKAGLPCEFLEDKPDMMDLE